MRSVATILMALAIAAPSVATTRNWTGTASGNWSDPANWGGSAPVAGDDLVFASPANASALINDYPADTLFHSITFQSVATFNVSGNELILGSGMSTQTSGGLTQAGATVNLSLPIVLGATQIWNVTTPGQLSLDASAALNLATYNLTIRGSGFSHSLGATITGSGGLFVSCWALTIKGNMNYTGPTIVTGSVRLVLATSGPISTPITINSFGSLEQAVGSATIMNALLTISGGAYLVTLNGTTPVQYSNITVNTGPITLGGFIGVTNNILSPIGTIFTIITNRTGSPVSGIFSGRPEGSTLVAGGQKFRISYVGGTGGDVTLTTIGTLDPTTTVLTSTPNPALRCEQITFGATVSPPATGTVTLKQGTQVLFQPVTLNASSQATILGGFADAGTYPVTAVYSGDTNYNGSTSNVVQQAVGTLKTIRISAWSSANPSKFGDNVSFMASLQRPCGGSAPTGTISFYEGAKLLGSVPFDFFTTTTFTTSALSVGTHTITATYSGDTEWATVSTTLAPQVVVAAPIPALDDGALAALALVIAAIALLRIKS